MGLRVAARWLPQGAPGSAHPQQLGVGDVGLEGAGKGSRGTGKGLPVTVSGSGWGRDLFGARSHSPRAAGGGLKPWQSWSPPGMDSRRAWAGWGWMRARHLGTWGRGRSAANPSSPWKGQEHPKDLRRRSPERCPAAFPAPFFPTSPHLRIEPARVSAPCSSCNVFPFNHDFPPGGPDLFRISYLTVCEGGGDQPAGENSRRANGGGSSRAKIRGAGEVGNCSPTIPGRSGAGGSSGMGNGDLAGLETTCSAWMMARDFGAGFNSPGAAGSRHPWVPPLRGRGAGCGAASLAGAEPSRAPLRPAPGR